MFDFLLAPLVVALRLPVLLQEAQTIALGQSSTGRSPEGERMVMEKIAAVNEGIMQATVEWSRANVELGTLAMQGKGLAFLMLAQQTPQRVAVAASAPAGHRLRSNARRLGVG
jgi:hypothetical protein